MCNYHQAPSPPPTHTLWKLCLCHVNGVRNVSNVVTPAICKEKDPLRATNYHIPFFLEPGLNMLIVPLVWCWHMKSNLDPTRLLVLLIGLMFLPPQPSHTEDMKWLAQSHNSKAQVGIKLTTLDWESPRPQPLHQARRGREGRDMIYPNKERVTQKVILYKVLP